MMQEPLKKHPDEDMNPIIRFLAESSLMILLIIWLVLFLAISQ